MMRANNDPEPKAEGTKVYRSLEEFRRKFLPDLAEEAYGSDPEKLGEVIGRDVVAAAKIGARFGFMTKR